MRFCDVVVINRFHGLDDTQKTQLTAWVKGLNPKAKLIWQAEQMLSEDNLRQVQQALKQSSQVLAERSHYQQISLTSFAQSHAPSTTQADTTPSPTAANDNLPFRYHDVQNGYQIIGWRVSADWTIDMTVLMEWLLALPNWQRIKSVVHIKHTHDEQWQTMNFTPDSLDLVACEPQTDNRIEVIFLDNTIELDFNRLDTELMMMFGLIG